MRTIVMIVLLLTGTKLYSPESQYVVVVQDKPIMPVEVLWMAVCYYESNNNPLAINIHEQAVGVAQIRQCRVDHYNDLTGKDYKLEDCFNRAVSREIFMFFATDDIEKTARSWNGSGRMTDIYWQKIMERL